LVELLVSMAVLGLIVFMISQMTNNAASVVASSGKHVDTDTEARVIFNRLAIEIGGMVKRSEVDYSLFKQPASTLSAVYGSLTEPENLQPGNDQLAFYTETEGYGNTQLVGGLKANASLVAYQVATDPYTHAPALLRLSQQLGWEPGAGSAWQAISYLPITMSQQWGSLFSSGSTGDFETVGDQVFRMEYTYLLKPSATGGASRLSITPWDVTATTPPHTSINGFQDVAAIVVTLALLDSRSRAVVSNYQNLTAIFPDAVDSSGDSTYHGDVAAAWNAKINSSTFASQAGIPQSAAGAVRVYERSFPLDTPP
jgi:hypothetical protein